VKLWLVLRNADAGYDTFRGFVLRAATEQEAWALVQEAHRNYIEHNIGNAGQREEWLIEELLPDGEQQLVLYDFLHG
jgi:hypothetical protein